MISLTYFPIDKEQVKPGDSIPIKFIKFGQMLSIRPDVLPPVVVESTGVQVELSDGVIGVQVELVESFTSVHVLPPVVVSSTSVHVKINDLLYMHGPLDPKFP